MSQLGVFHLPEVLTTEQAAGKVLVRTGRNGSFLGFSVPQSQAPFYAPSVKDPEALEHLIAHWAPRGPRLHHTLAGSAALQPFGVMNLQETIRIFLLLRNNSSSNNRIVMLP